MGALKRMHPVESIALTVLFGVAICLPVVKQFVAGEPDTSAIEMHRQAPAPTFDWKRSMKELPQQIDAWFDSHFGFRYFLLQADAALRAECFGESDRVVVGKRGWLFLKIEPPLFTQSLDAPALDAWKNYLETRRRWLARRGIQYLFVVAADKDSVYPEYLPRSAGPPPAELPVDQLIRHLRETHSPVEVLSLRDALLAAKTREIQRLYCKQDTHWNSVGAFYGYKAIMDRLAPLLPSLKPKSRGDYRLVHGSDGGYDLLHIGGLPAWMQAKGPQLVPVSPADVHKRWLTATESGLNPFRMELAHPGNLPTAVIDHDSFTMVMVPYLSQSFSRITYLAAGNNPAVTEKVIMDTVLQEKPDVFIEERIQRAMPAIPDAKTVFQEP
jgi:hypothetical protein